MKMKFIIAGLLVAGTLALGQKVSKGEGEAWNAVVSAQTPEARIAAVDNLLAKYKDTQFKATALELAGEAYQRKGDGPNAIVYGNRALEADPKNFQAMLLVSGQLAQMTKEFDLDKDEKLKRATKLASDALPLIGTAPKPNPQIPDEEWNAYKKDQVGLTHETLGIIASIDKKWDTAIAEFKLAIDNASAPEPTAMIRLAAVYNNAKKYDEATAIADKVLATAGASDNLKKIANEEKARAAKGKGQK